MEVPAIHIQSDKGLGVKYADSIDLSNACRAFYQARLESTRRLKEKWRDSEEIYGDGCCNNNNNNSNNSSSNNILSCGNNSSGSSRRGSDSDGSDSRNSIAGKTNGRKKTSLDAAIDLLRREMAALMDQDLCLMKQLLTLNEEIEDLKWRRRHGWSRASSFCSSDMIQSEASLGRVDEHPNLEFLTPSSLSLQLDSSTTRLSVYNEDDPVGTFNRISTTATVTDATDDAKDISDKDTERQCHNNCSNCNTTNCCMDNTEHNDAETKIEGTASTIDNAVSLESTFQRTSHELTVVTPSGQETSPIACSILSNGHVCNKKAAGSYNAEQTSTNVSTTQTVGKRAQTDEGYLSQASPITTERLISSNGPKSSPCAFRRKKRLIEADAESHDSGVHDCFGTI